MELNRLITLIVFSLVILGLSSAVEVTLEPIKTTIEPGQAVKYNVTVKNTESAQNRYTLFMLNPSFQISQGSLILNPGESESVLLNLYISNDTNIGVYFDTFYVNYDDKTDTFRIDYTVDVPFTKRVKVDSLIPQKTFSPNNSLIINITTLNVAATKGIVLDVEVFKNSVETYSFKKELDAPTGEETQQVLLDFDSDVPPGEYLFRFSVKFLGDEIYQSVETIEITPFTEINVNKEVDKTVFGKTVTITLTNKGTGVEEYYSFSEKLSTLESMLVTTKDGAQRTSEGLVWEIYNISPSSTLQYTYSITYIPLLLLPFFISGALLIFILWNRRVVVEKSIYNYKMKEGELEVDFRITVKNVSFQKLTSVVISEDVPSFVKSVHGFGSLKPRHIKGKRTHKLQWELPSLKPREEVIVSYKIKTNMEIIGRVNFPPTKVYVKDKSGIYIRKSNMIEIETHSKTLENLEK